MARTLRLRGPLRCLIILIVMRFQPFCARADPVQPLGTSYILRACIWENQERCKASDRRLLNVTFPPEPCLLLYRKKHFNQWLSKSVREALMVIGMVMLPISIFVGVCDSLWVPIVLPSWSTRGTDENVIRTLVIGLAQKDYVRHIWQPWFWEGGNVWYVSKFAGLDSLVRFMALLPCVCIMTAFDAYTSDLLVDLLPPQLPNAYLLARIHDVGGYKAVITLLGSTLLGCGVWIAGMQLAMYVLLNIFDPENDDTLVLLHRSAQFKAATKRLEDWLEGVFVAIILATMWSILRYKLASAAWEVSYPTLGDYNTVAGWLPLPLLLDFPIILLNGVLAIVVIGLAHRQYMIVQWHCDLSDEVKLKYMMRMEAKDDPTFWAVCETHWACCRIWAEYINLKWVMEFHLRNNALSVAIRALQGLLYSFRQPFYDAVEDFSDHP